MNQMTEPHPRGSCQSRARLGFSPRDGDLRQSPGGLQRGVGQGLNAVPEAAERVHQALDEARNGVAGAADAVFGEACALAAGGEGLVWVAAPEAAGQAAAHVPRQGPAGPAAAPEPGQPRAEVRAAGGAPPEPGLFEAPPELRAGTTAAAGCGRLRRRRRAAVAVNKSKMTRHLRVVGSMASAAGARADRET